ncbi:uncharacterized protein MELLADRAFT_92480 [Melampsora larici-populina 98AG31]|uniref:J domain-containing protein n=1 Tax=Melampsora larici-populina (strain 98AG31 / pathotype 3-4-7) TaxID=747676 RepID=F4R8L7_MELLP|nr:uncharacterized protein MELLADRAFT_92480 [Melampsora larici-populina 98AG31]EGG11040.1 hypothetical protein MELLADRAFT_92480 [Melampsora larici-populina 98AG31]
MLSQNIPPDNDARRPIRRKFDSLNVAEVEAQDVEVVGGEFTANKSYRYLHIKSRIRDMQSGSNFRSAQCEEASEAFERGDYAAAARIYQELLNSCELESSAKNGFQNNATVQMCLQLTECYLQLQCLHEAEMILGHLWRPNGKFTIGATHPLFFQTSLLYARLQAQFEGCSGAKDKETNNRGEQHPAEALELFYMYGYEYVKKGLSEQAAGVFRQGLKYLDQFTMLPEERTKEVAVRIHLALSETCIAMDRIEEASKLLEEVWLPGKPLSIEQHHKNFLWLAKLHAQVRSPGVYHPNIAEPLNSRLSFYQRLGVTHTATKQEIRKGYLEWSRWFHPDRGGDTGVMQQLLEAYQTLAHEGKRSKYNESLKHESTRTVI